MAARTRSETPATLIDRHQSDRFVGVAPIGLTDLRRAEQACLDVLPDDVEQLVLAPHVPFGSHATLGPLSQNRLLSTIRRVEAAADPTVGLALEAAVRRRRLLETDPKSPQWISLATVQRITRTQRFDGPLQFAHFSLFGLVTAGRDTGSRTFEHQASVFHLQRVWEAGLRCGADRVEIDVSDFGDGSMLDLASMAAERAPGNVAVEIDPDRQAGRGYYPSFCFKARVVFGEQAIETADGGFVDWSKDLIQSKKERMMVSGISLDRIAVFAPRT